MTTTIHTLALGTMDNLIHIIADDKTQQAMVVDPGWDAAAILAYIAEHGLTLTGILLTHTHYDHISAVHEMLTSQDIPVYISHEEYQLGLLRLDNVIFVADNETITLGDNILTVLLTPGHTRGSVCYLINDELITGDTLFVNGCGRCNFLESDVNKMFDSMQRLKSLPDTLTIRAGHDYGHQQTDTLGQQKQTNPYLLIDDSDFFVEFRMNLQAEYRSIPFTPSSKAEMDEIYRNHFA